MPKQMSYDFLNGKRDLSDLISTITKASPVLQELIRISPIPAKNTKHEWMEDVVAPKWWTLNANYTVADWVMVLVTNTGLKIGDILWFEKVTAQTTSTLQAKVTAINVNGTGISISVYGGSTDENLATGAKIYLIARPKNDGTSPDPDDGYEPTPKFNYTQIFDRTAKISKTTDAVDMYGIQRMMAYQETMQVKDIMYELAKTIIVAPRVLRTQSEPGTMGGIVWFLQQGSGNKVAAWGAVSSIILNNAFLLAKNNGAVGIRLLVCHPLQAKKISAFNTTGNNPVVQRTDTTTGSYVTTFVSDQGDVVTIVADLNFPKDMIALLDMSKINLVPLQGRALSAERADRNGDDFLATRILGEYTLEVKNADNAHVLITGLTV